MEHLDLVLEDGSLVVAVAVFMLMRKQVLLVPAAAVLVLLMVIMEEMQLQILAVAVADVAEQMDLQLHKVVMVEPDLSWLDINKHN